MEQEQLIILNKKRNMSLLGGERKGEAYLSVQVRG